MWRTAGQQEAPLLPDSPSAQHVGRGACWAIKVGGLDVVCFTPKCQWAQHPRLICCRSGAYTMLSHTLSVEQLRDTSAGPAAALIVPQSEIMDAPPQYSNSSCLIQPLVAKRPLSPFIFVNLRVCPCPPKKIRSPKSTLLSFLLTLPNSRCLSMMKGWKLWWFCLRFRKYVPWSKVAFDWGWPSHF